MEKGYAMSVDHVLSRLNKVRKSGQHAWMACCPAHNDKTASLAISDNGDGRILLNCFAGCDTYSILRSIGLDWHDVMPESAIGHRLEKTSFGIYSTDALRLIRFETQIVLYIAYQMRKNKSLDQESIERLETAMQRINKAMVASNVKN